MWGIAESGGEAVANLGLFRCPLAAFPPGWLGLLRWEAWTLPMPSDRKPPEIAVIPRTLSMHTNTKNH